MGKPILLAQLTIESVQKPRNISHYARLELISYAFCIAVANNSV